MSFKTDYKDEIPQNGKRLYNIIDDKTGAVINQNVRVARSNGNTQNGDEFGAIEVNEIHKYMNDMTNPNLLINSDFRICQRFSGNEVTAINGQYCADRWRVYCSNVSAKIVFEKVSNGLKIKSINGSTTSTIKVNLYQPYDKTEVSNLIGKKCKVQESVNGAVRTYDRTLVIENGTNYVSLISINNLSVGDIVNWAKVELGESATNYSPKNYSEELTACERYFVKYHGVSVVLYQGWFNSLRDNLIMVLFLPTLLRNDTPTLNISDIRIIDSATGAVIEKSRLTPSLYKIRENTIAIKISMTDGSIFGTGVHNGDIWLAADAEIY